MRETKRASDIIFRLRNDHKCFVINIAGGPHQMAGLPDCVIIKDGKHIWVEWKNGDSKGLNLAQARIHDQMEKQSVKVFVVVFLSDKEWLIDDLKSIKFNSLREGVKELLDVLLHATPVG